MARARPDGSTSPYGAYLCPKGMASVDFHNGGEGRLFSSLKSGVSGRFTPLDGEAAMDQIAARLAGLVAEHGPRAIAVYHGTGAYRSVLGGLMERAWVSALGTPNFFSTMTIDQSAKWLTMARMGMMASGKPGLRDADVALLVGGNPVVSHQGAPLALGESGAPGRSFERARERGCRIIMIDPRRSETARYADLLIQPLPGRDAELFAAIAHVLLRDGTIDHAFCRRHCIQLEELRAAIAPFTPEMAAKRADVPVHQIEQAAMWLAQAKRPVVGSGTGPSMADHSSLADHMIETVGALAGGFRRAGDAVCNPGTLKPRVFREMAIAPTRSWERGPKCLSANIGPLMNEFPSALIPAEIMADSPDRIRALIVFGGDPLMAMGDPALAAAAFEKLELLVSLDSRMNETARRAHYVVATSQPFERHDLGMSADGLYPEAYAQYTAPVVPKPDGLVHDWEFYWGIAARMGLELTFKYWTYGQTYREIEGGLKLSLTEKPDPVDLCRYLARDSAVPFDRLAAGEGGVRPDTSPHFVEAVPDSGASARLHLCPPDIARDLAELAREMPDTRFAFRLTSRRILHAINGAYRDSPGARRRYPVNYLFMNPGDMRACRIEEGSLVEITSQFGTIRTLARSEDRLRGGVVSITHMFGPLVGSGDPMRDGGANVGNLTSLTEALEPITFMPRFSALRVNVKPVQQE